jgi:hypothetical protein
MNKTKKWWQSKTVWAQIITIAVGVLLAVQGVVDTKVGVIVLVSVVALLNGILRVYFTDSGIEK